MQLCRDSDKCITSVSEDAQTKSALKRHLCCECKYPGALAPTPGAAINTLHGSTSSNFRVQLQWHLL